MWNLDKEFMEALFVFSVSVIKKFLFKFKLKFKVSKVNLEN